MKLSRLGQLIATAWLFSGMVQAAEVEVPFGKGSLATAIASAAEGDTLILGNGNYTDNGAVVIDKALTIRGVNRAASAVIAADSFTIDAANKDIVLQGVDFAVDVTVKAASDLKVLESQFLSGHDLDVTNYKTSEGDGTLMVIGNHFVPSSIITTIYSVDAYIAGNTFDKGYLISKVPVWIVGNYINGTTDIDTININTPGSAQILANRIFMNTGAPFSHSRDAIDATAGTALVAGNIVQINGSGSRIRRGILLSSSTYAKVFNNIVDQGAGSASGNSTGNSYGILAYGEVSGNIVTNLKSKFTAIGGSGIENNLCFGNDSNSCGSNAITTDPLLIDRIDYKLSTDSPAINAGPANIMLADLDRTRNDIGAYGGPWSIAQYDVQRDPLYFGPYVYPLFKANASFVDGKIQVRAIGVARLR